jgi:hypothetical protein
LHLRCSSRGIPWAQAAADILVEVRQEWGVDVSI